MASTSYAATEEMTNINRVSRLLMGPCTDQLRDLLRFYIPPASFPAVIQTVMSRLPRLTEPQRKLILPNYGVYSGNYDDMDISLLYILLRNICGIQAHNKGWGNTPDSGDRSISANIERLRLARNHCGHYTGVMSNAEFNQIWSDIRAAAVDLDKNLSSGCKYQKMVDFVRNDTMDPVNDRRHRDKLLEQIKEMENFEKKVDSLKRKTEENYEQVKQKMQKVEASQQRINERYIPPNIKEQHKALLKSWQKEDLPFHEIHSFSNILDKVQSQPITTIIGGPGSGKTSTARHLALRLQTEFEFEIVPVLSVSDAIQYGHPKFKQLFILDEVIGVYGVEYEKISNLERYKESIFNVLGEHSRILFTCRKAVYNESLNLKSFVLKEDCIVDLEDNINRLNAEDREQILHNHCKHNDISLRPDELPNVSSAIGCMMYPLLCKLFCSKSNYQALGREFFDNPHICIRNEIDKLRGHNKIQYASLVMCMFCQNEITESMMTQKDSVFMEIKEKVFESCRVSGRNSEIKDALDDMINTFTIRTNKSYSLIHDSVNEVLAFHYGNKHQEDMLEYMSSSFVANKFSISDISEDPCDLHIKIEKEHYPAFAERLVRDLKSLELHDVFMNRTLKLECICGAFIDELKKMSYHELKKLFFQKQEYTLEISMRRDIKNFNRESKCSVTVDRQRQKLLKGNTMEKSNIQVISLVVTYGHSQLLQFLFDLVTEHKESIRRVMNWEIMGRSGNDYASDLVEQTRLLILSCYSGDVKVVKLLLKHCDIECINDLLYSYDNHLRSIASGLVGITPLYAASQAGYSDIVDLLIKSGADCNKSCENDTTPLHEASYAGHGDIVDVLIKGGADCNISDKNGTTPLYAAADAGCGYIVDLLIKAGADCNKGDENGRTPLFQASFAGYGDIVDLLIKSGADCNSSDENGRTPLFIASYVGRGEIVDLQLKSGTNCNKSDDNGTSPLFEVTYASRGNIVDLLIKGGADCNKSDKYGTTPLHKASVAGHGDIVDMLIKGGADCNISDKNGTTPLYAASDAGCGDIVDFLIKAGAECNKSDTCGRSPLYVASKGGNFQPEKWSRFLSFGASMSDYESIVRALIKSGADINQTDINGESPLSVARTNKRHTIAEILLKHGAKSNIM